MLLKSSRLLRWKYLGLAALIVCEFGLQGCARVLQRERGFLADPILQRNPDALENQLETHNLPRREGSAGGNSGSGGGCGC